MTLCVTSFELSHIMTLFVISFSWVTSWRCLWCPLIESHHDVVCDTLWIESHYDVVCDILWFSHIMMLFVTSFDLVTSWHCLWHPLNWVTSWHCLWHRLIESHHDVVCDILWFSYIMMLFVTSFDLLTSWHCLWCPLIESHSDVVCDILWFAHIMMLSVTSFNWVKPWCCLCDILWISHIMTLFVMSFDWVTPWWHCVWHPLI